MAPAADSPVVRDRGESRLDGAIAYYRALASMLDEAAARAATLDGPVLIVGLGNGRSFDHLRERLPGRRFLAYDLHDRAHPQSRPAAVDLFLSCKRQGIEDALSRMGAPAALIHCDFRHGLAYDEKNLPLVRFATSLCPGGLLSLEWPEADLPGPALPLLEVSRGAVPGLFLLCRGAGL